MPEAIARAVSDRLTERDGSTTTMPPEKATELIDQVAAEMKSNILSQTISNRMRYFANRTSKDASTVATEAIDKLDNDWGSLEDEWPSSRESKRYRRSIVASSMTLVSLTAPQLIRNLAPEMIASDLLEILSDINRFAR